MRHHRAFAEGEDAGHRGVHGGGPQVSAGAKILRRHHHGAQGFVELLQDWSTRLLKGELPRDVVGRYGSARCVLINKSDGVSKRLISATNTERALADETQRDDLKDRGAPLLAGQQCLDPDACNACV